MKITFFNAQKGKIILPVVLIFVWYFVYHYLSFYIH